jgi:DNA (cytosine-5)-methyltransferase 1
MLEFLRACREIDPEWVVGENVPGLLSSHGGRDFQTLLDAVAILWPDGGAAWRVLDAQFARVPVRDGDGRVAGWFGPVAQRRRRIFLVINTRDWRRAGAVLFEPESLSGDFETSREKREALARAAGRGPASAGSGGFCGYASHTARSIGYEEEQSPTLTAGYHKLTGFSRECEAYRTIPLECPACGSNAEVSVDDPQEPEIFWRYSCGCSSLGCEKYGRLRRSWPTREESIADWNKDVLLSFSIDYKQTPKVNEEICHTLTHEGDGGIHSAVAFAQNTRNEVRLQGGDGQRAGTVEAQPGKNQTYVMTPAQGGRDVLCRAHSHANAETGRNLAPTVTAHNAKDAPIVCMADDNAKAAIDEDVCGTLKVAGGGTIRSHAVASNGEEVIGPLCARDHKGVGSEYVSEGKVICQRAKS